MKATVLKPFYGIKEEVDFAEGDTFEGTKERIEEINDALPGYLKVIPSRSRKSNEKEDEKVE